MHHQRTSVVAWRDLPVIMPSIISGPPCGHLLPRRPRMTCATARKVRRRTALGAELHPGRLLRRCSLPRTRSMPKQLRAGPCAPSPLPPDFGNDEPARPSQNGINAVALLSAAGSPELDLRIQTYQPEYGNGSCWNGTRWAGSLCTQRRIPGGSPALLLSSSC